MKTRFAYILLLLLIAGLAKAQPPAPRQRAMGRMSVAVPNAYHPLDLYGFAGNTAWLQQSDSLTWARYQIASDHSQGSLRRLWDAEAVHQNGLVFTGQKRLSQTQLFYGEIEYNRDYYDRVHYAIEPHPYAHDPFVLTDTTVGDFSWYGPRVKTVFSQRLLKHLYLGISLNYGIQRGFKKQNTMPEIISRNISGSLDLAYELSDALVLGVSYRPFNNQDITNLATLPDGTTPLTRRYRGENMYREFLSKADRTAEYSGHEERLQLSMEQGHIHFVAYGGYGYLWHELFDGTTQQYYDGYFQEERYFFRTALRNEWKNLRLAMRYGVWASTNWAKEPTGNLRIYDANYFSQELNFGGMYRLQNVPLVLAAEALYRKEEPQRNDYLAKEYRQGANTTVEWHTGIELNSDEPLTIRAGYVYTEYNEAAVWNYFGDYSGPAFTAGATYRAKGYELSGTWYFGRSIRNHGLMQHVVDRKQWYVHFDLRKFFSN